MARSNKCAISGLVLFIAALSQAQTAPTFSYKLGAKTYTLVGSDPAQSGTTEIPVTLVPVALSFDSSKASQLDATPDMPALMQSPLFAPSRYSENGGAMQYGDALLRATFRHAQNWHTTLSHPEVSKTVQIRIPRAFGYVLTSQATATQVGIADLEYVQRELFRQVPPAKGNLVIAVTHNTAFYAEGDATICCLWGTHGADQATGNSFVLASYLSAAPAIVQDQDVQPLTEQFAEFLYDPLHDPLIRQENTKRPGNQFPRWMRPATMRPGDQGRCGGTGVASAYFLLEPTDTNLKNNFPYSKPFAVHHGTAEYHVQNVALLPWYLGPSGTLGNVFSFPDPHVLLQPAKACPALDRESASRTERTITPASRGSAASSHALIGYWTGSGRHGAPFPLHNVSPQWDIIIVAFATPDHTAPEGTLRFELPTGIPRDEFKRDVAERKRQGKKVLLSLGGGGQYFTLDHKENITNFVSSVGQIVHEYGFDGVDIDFETPSLVLADTDTDFHHPTTPSVVNLLAGLRQLHDEIGPSFMISLVPEGPQIPAGHVTYGGQFGSYLPLAYGLRDILSFMDVQDYNTPPLQGLDGEIYQAGSVNYHAAMTDLVLQGFTVGGGEAGQTFPALPEDHVAVGFLTGETTPQIVEQSMRYLITGQRPSSATYKLRNANGYPKMIGAMFWTIDDDHKEDFRFSNLIGPELHSFDTVTANAANK